MRALLRAGLKLWLLTSGLSLAKHARAVAPLFDSVTVSLDGTDAPTYQAIRGLDAFERMRWHRAAAAAGTPVTLRVTLQRANFRSCAPSCCWRATLAPGRSPSSPSMSPTRTLSPAARGRRGARAAARDLRELTR